MSDQRLKEILLELVASLDCLEEEVRALQVLTTHRVDANTTAKMEMPQRANALHVRLKSLREKVQEFVGR